MLGPEALGLEFATGLKTTNGHAPYGDMTA